MSNKQRAVKAGRNKDTAKPTRTPPFDAATIKPWKHGSDFSSCPACVEAGTASTCAHIAEWDRP